MFVILIPIGLAPLITTLLWSERITRRRGLGRPREPKKAHWQRILDTAEELDVIGLLLIGASVSLTLLPLSLARHTTTGWNGGMLPLESNRSLLNATGSQRPCSRFSSSESSSFPSSPGGISNGQSIQSFPFDSWQIEVWLARRSSEPWISYGV